MGSNPVASKSTKLANELLLLTYLLCLLVFSYDFTALLSFQRWFETFPESFPTEETKSSGGKQPCSEKALP